MNDLNQTTKVSIVLPTYNGARYIREALDSVIEQTYKNWELIIINDCSTDETLDICNKYVQKDERIKVYSNSENLRVSASLNKGFKLSTGTYWTWISDDNMFKPKAIEFMVDALNANPDIGLVSCNFDFMDENKKFLYTLCDLLQNRTVEELAFKCNIGACFMYRKELALKSGEYDTEMFCAEDYDYWCKLALNGNIKYFNENLYSYRANPYSLSSTKRDRMIARTYDIKRKYGLAILKKINASKKTQVNFLLDFFKQTKDVSLLKQACQISFLNVLYFAKKFIFNFIFSIRRTPKHRKLTILGIKMNFRLNTFFYSLNVRRYGDERGILTTLEEKTDIPFNIKRTYYLSNLSAEKDRAHHAHKHSQRVLTAIQGSCRATLFDGKFKQTFELDSPNKAVYFNKKVWCELSEFEENTIILALASEKYNEKDYIRNYDDFLKYIRRK